MQELAGHLADGQRNEQNTRKNEIVIGGFGKKTKLGAMKMIEQIIEGVAGNPQIVSDRVGNAPTIVPVQFASTTAANDFLDKFRNKKDFPGYFDGFWTNLSQS